MIISFIQITKVPENLFKNNKELLFVEFGRNQITELPRYLFRSNVYLDEVSFILKAKLNLKLRFIFNKIRWRRFVEINSDRIQIFESLISQRITSFQI